MSSRYWYCKVCAGPVRPELRAGTIVWLHERGGADHGPIPTTKRPVTA